MGRPTRLLENFQGFHSPHRLQTRLRAPRLAGAPRAEGQQEHRPLFASRPVTVPLTSLTVTLGKRDRRTVCHYSIVPHLVCFTMPPGPPTARDSLVTMSSARRLASAGWQMALAPSAVPGIRDASRAPWPSVTVLVCAHRITRPASLPMGKPCAPRPASVSVYWTWEIQSSDIHQPWPLPSFGSWHLRPLRLQCPLPGVLRICA